MERDGRGWGGGGSECLRWRLSGNSLFTDRVVSVQIPLPSGKMRVVVNVMIFRLPAIY